MVKWAWDFVKFREAPEIYFLELENLGSSVAAKSEVRVTAMEGKSQAQPMVAVGIPSPPVSVV